MPLTKFRVFVDSLEAMTVTGVSRNYTQGPPLGAPTDADIPALFVRYPTANEARTTFGTHGGWPTFRVDVVVAVKAVGQDTAPANFDATVDMMDNLSTALRTESCIVLSKMAWTIKQSIEEVAGQPYWAVVASVEGSG